MSGWRLGDNSDWDRVTATIQTTENTIVHKLLLNIKKCELRIRF